VFYGKWGITLFETLALEPSFARELLSYADLMQQGEEFNARQQAHK
jgi:hypothetical protein